MTSPYRFNASHPDFDPRLFLKSLFDAAVAAADPVVGIRKHLPAKPKGRTVVVGAGKGAAQMARALEALWDGPLSGVVVTRYGYGCPTTIIEVIEASHPVPDAAGIVAARRLTAAISELGPDDLVIALVCGGGSALLPAPPPGFSLQDEIALNEILLSSGAPISAMNAIRKHFSMIKGGRLAAATRAKVVSLVVSDIPGDNPAFVASGPTLPDDGTRTDALDAIRHYALRLPLRMLEHISSPHADAPSPRDPMFARNSAHIIASASISLDAAAELAQKSGFQTAVLSDSIEGETRDVAYVHAAIVREIALRNRPFGKPVVLLSGGETTVTLRGAGGKGGRNSEFALSAALLIDGMQAVVLAADTDGIDGSETNAGAFADGTTIRRLRSLRIDPRALLSRNDSYTGFAAIGDLFLTGPTGTNVNDFRAVVVF
ncbi:glycerate kinase [Rhizobium sp. RAF36]|uniref:glycerate kinase type-2 family protein n=1 Tax=Rhizobium sp. RAF36 TaxID=3233055 RepID=UPI003F94A497